MSAKRSLTGRAVLITGASSGVGQAAAEAFAAAGADVAVLARSRPGLERAAKRVRAHGRRAVIVQADLTDREAVATAVAEAIEGLGSIDVLVPCAAMTIYGTFEEVSPEDFDRVIDVTFIGAVNVVRAVLPELERSRGQVVAVGSLMSKLPLPMLSSYAAAKHAERGFLNTLSIELRARRSPVKVSILHPGAINTPVWDEMPTANGELPRRPPYGHDPDDVAEALVDLALRPRPEVSFGLETKAIEAIWQLSRPVGDFMLVTIQHYFQSGTRTASSSVGAVRRAVGEGVASDGLPLPLALPRLPHQLVRHLR